MIEEKPIAHSLISHYLQETKSLIEEEKSFLFNVNFYFAPKNMLYDINNGNMPDIVVSPSKIPNLQYRLKILNFLLLNLQLEYNNI